MTKSTYLDIAEELRRKVDADADASAKHYDQNITKTIVPLDDPSGERPYKNVSLIRLFNGFDGKKESWKAEITEMSMPSYSLLTSGKREVSIHDIKGITDLARVILRCPHHDAFTTGIESALLKNILPEHLKQYVSDPTAEQRKEKYQRILNARKKTEELTDKHTEIEENAGDDSYFKVEMPMKYAFLTGKKDLLPIITEFSPDGVTMFKSWVKTDDGWETKFIEGENKVIDMVSHGTKLRAKNNELHIKESAYKIGSKIKKLDAQIKHLVSIDVEDNVTILV